MRGVHKRDLERCSRLKSGFRNVMFDRKKGVLNPWFVKRGVYRSCGFSTPVEAAVQNWLCAQHEKRTAKSKVPTSTAESAWMDKSTVAFAREACDLFGARIEMRRGATSAKAVVKSWMPCADAGFGIVFDDNPGVVLHEDLLRRGRDDWRQIEWEGDIWETSKRRPTCPQCLHPLGVGRSAWTFCSACRHMEPGAMSATVSKRMRSNDPYRRDRPNYAEDDV